MKKTTLKRIAAVTLSLLALLAMLTVTAFATETEVVTDPVTDATTETVGTVTPADTVTSLLEKVFSGTTLALLGAAIAVALPCMGSAKGVGIVGEASSGLLSQDPSQFGKALALQALPMTQGVRPGGRIPDAGYAGSVR